LLQRTKSCSQGGKKQDLPEKERNHVQKGRKDTLIEASGFFQRARKKNPKRGIARARIEIKSFPLLEEGLVLKISGEL